MELSQCGPYRVLGRLGGGGFSTVYNAVDARTGGPVALKVLQESRSRDAQFTKRFLRAARAAQSLIHPNIVRVVDFGEYGGYVFLAMELIEGSDLISMVKRRGGFAPNDIQAVGVQIATALNFAHRRKIVHRDVKPHNVRVTPAGLCKVTDFDIARIPDQSLETLDGTVLGTPQYIAPEIWEGGPVDGRTDVYSLGIVLYEMAVGHPPYQGDIAAVMRQHLTSRPVALTQIRSDFPMALSAVILRAMARYPNDRFRSAGELASALLAPSAPIVVSSPRALGDRYVFRSGRREWPVPNGRFVVGHNRSCGVVVVAPGVEARHAQVDSANGSYFVRDLGTRTGTFVNGRPVVGSIRLSTGDWVRVGAVALVFSKGPMPSLATGAANPWIFIAHANAVFLVGNMWTPLVWALVPAAIWATIGRTSPDAAFHACQATLFQLLVGVILVTAQIFDQDLFAAIWLVAATYGLVGAFRAERGKPFEYLGLGALAREFVAPSSGRSR